MSRPRILIVGAGFAGYRTARTLARLTRQKADITLLNPTDHREEGGIGDAVLDAFLDGRPLPRLARLAVRTMPGSVSPDEQLHAAGIDAEAIMAAGRLLAEKVIAP